MTLLGATPKGLAIFRPYTHHFTMSYSFQRVKQGGILGFQWFKLVKVIHEDLQYHSNAILHIKSIGVQKGKTYFFEQEDFFNNMLSMLGPQWRKATYAGFD